MPAKTQFAGRVQISVRLPPDLHDRVKEAARARRTSINWIIQDLIDRHLSPPVPPGTSIKERPWDPNRAP